MSKKPQKKRAEPKPAREGADAAPDDYPPGPAEGCLTPPERLSPRPEGGFVPRGRKRRVARTTLSSTRRVKDYTGEERLLILDTWIRSELPARDFSHLVGVSSATLAQWKRRFEAEGPAGLLGYRKGRRGSRVPEHVKRAILMMKDQHPDWGQDRIHDMLLRTQGLQVSGWA